MSSNLNKFVNYGIAFIWFANGLFCKLLNLVPRHEQIIAKILSENFAEYYTAIIGFLEILMAIWILSRFRSRLNAIIQMLIIATMNILEFLLVPDLLLWGKMNVVFAFLLIWIIYLNEFKLNKSLK